MHPEEAVKAKEKREQWPREKGKWTRLSETQNREMSGRGMLEPDQEWC